MKFTVLRNIIVITILLLSWDKLFSTSEESNKYTSLVMTGNSPTHNGRAFTGVSDYYTDSLMFNSASPGGLNADGYAINYGNITGDYSYPSFTGVTSNRFFKIGFGYSAINYFDTDSIDTHILQLALAKEYTPDLSIGFGVNYYHLNYYSATSYTSLSLGAIYKFGYQYIFNSNLGIYNLRAGVSYTPGFFLTGKEEYSNMSNGTMGYSFDFLRFKTLTTRWYHEVSFLTDYFQLPFKHGVEFNYNEKFFFRGGFVFPDAYGYGDHTFGLGYKLTNKTFSGSLNYAMVHEKGYDYVHYMGIDFSFASTLDEKDDITLTIQEPFFSPNDDSIKERIYFYSQEYDNITNWGINIKNHRGELINHYDYISLYKGNLIEQVLTKQSNTQFPESFYWDGIDNKGEKAPDGIYYAEIEITTRQKKRVLAKSPLFFLDTLAPDYDTLFDKSIYSLENDTASIRHIFNTSPNDHDTYTAKIIQKKTNRVVKEFLWKGNSVPELFSWRFTDSQNNPLSAGKYAYEYEGGDQAGNRVQSKTIQFELVKNLFDVSISEKEKYYSAKDSVINFSLSIPQKELCERYQIVITDMVKNRVREIEYTVVEDEQQVPITDLKSEGEYYYYLKVFYTNGKYPESSLHSFIIDNTPPEIEIQSASSSFNPEVTTDISYDILTTEEERLEVLKWYAYLFYEGELVDFESNAGILPETLTFSVDPNRHRLKPLTSFSFRLEAYDKSSNLSVNTLNDPAIVFSELEEGTLSFVFKFYYINRGKEFSDTSKKRFELARKIIHDKNNKSLSVRYIQGMGSKKIKKSVILEKYLDVTPGEYKLTWETGKHVYDELRITYNKE